MFIYLYLCTQSFSKRTYRMLISAVQICFQGRRTLGSGEGAGGRGQSPLKILTGIAVKTFPSKDLEILLTPLPGFSDLPTVLIDESHKKFISTTRYIFVSSHCLFFILQELEAKLEDMLQEKVPPVLPTDEEFEV